MRRAAAVALLVVAACGGGQRAAKPDGPSERERACNHYGTLIGPFLERFSDALDEYQLVTRDAEDGVRAEAARTMADFVIRELDDLRAIRPRSAELADAHGELIAALELLGQGLEQQSTALVLGDQRLELEAMKRVNDAFERWSVAGRRIARECPSK